MRATVTEASLRVSRCYHTPGAAPGSAAEGNAGGLRRHNFRERDFTYDPAGSCAALTPSGNPGGWNER
jgi:hypothetical protein